MAGTDGTVIITIMVDGITVVGVVAGARVLPLVSELESARVSPMARMALTPTAPTNRMLTQAVETMPTVPNGSARMTRPRVRTSGTMANGILARKLHCGAGDGPGAHRAGRAPI